MTMAGYPDGTGMLLVKGVLQIKKCFLHRGAYRI